MKKSSWVLYLYEDETKKELFKIMEFKTVKQVGYTLGIDPQLISNWFHGLINPRGILKNCNLFQTLSFV